MLHNIQHAKNAAATLWGSSFGRSAPSTAVTQLLVVVLVLVPRPCKLVKTASCKSHMAQPNQQLRNIPALP